MAGHSSIIATPSGSHIVFYGVLEQSSQAEQRSRFIVGPRHFTLLTESIDTTALHDLQPQYGDCSDESTSDREYIKVRRTHMGSTQTSAMCNTAAPASIRRLITVADSLIRVTVTQ